MVHRYIALTQPPYCCVPTALMMVLNRRKLPLLQIDEIGCELGLAVPEEARKLYPKALLGVRPASGYGTQVQNSKFSLNRFLESHDYPLREMYFPSSPESDVVTWVQSLLKENADIMVCFNNAALFGGSSDWGHVCLIDSIDNCNVTLVDSEPNQPKFRTTGFDALCNAIKVHGESNRGGFWVLRDAQAA